MCSVWPCGYGCGSRGCSVVGVLVCLAVVVCVVVVRIAAVGFGRVW